MLGALSSCRYDRRAEPAPVLPTDSTRYSETIRPLLDAHCMSCHSSFLTQGDLVLETYPQVKATVDKNSLLSSLRGINGYKLMPETGSLSEAEIAAVENWVRQGAKNN